MNNYAPQKGFVLVATVWLLAILSMAAAVFAAWVNVGVKNAQRQHDYTQGSIDIASTKSTLFYLLATQGMTSAGLTIPTQGASGGPQKAAMSLDDFLAGAPPSDMGQMFTAITGSELRLDGSVYEGSGSAYFSIYDDSGLISLNTPQNDRLTRFLMLVCCSLEKSKELVDKLQDYTDADDFHRLNGAESYHYAQKKLEPPANAPLFSRFHAKKILGWQDAGRLWASTDAIDSLSAARLSIINVNTATKITLMAAFELTGEQAQTIINARKERPFQSEGELQLRTKISLLQYSELISFMPSTSLRVLFWYKGARLNQQISVRLSNLVSRGSPWLIASDISLALPGHYVKTQPIKPQTGLFD